MIDYYQPYETFVLSKKHTQSKAETFTVEGYNSLFRHYFGKNEKKVKMLQKVRSNAGILIQIAHGEMERRIKYVKLSCH